MVSENKYGSFMEMPSALLVDKLATSMWWAGLAVGASTPDLAQRAGMSWEQAAVVRRGVLDELKMRGLTLDA